MLTPQQKKDVQAAYAKALKQHRDDLEKYEADLAKFYEDLQPHTDALHASTDHLLGHGAFTHARLAAIEEKLGITPAYPPVKPTEPEKPE